MQKTNKVWVLFLLVFSFYLLYIGIIISKYNFNLTCLVGMSEEFALRYKSLMPKDMICFIDKGAYDGQFYYVIIANNLNLKTFGERDYKADRILYLFLSYLFSAGGKKYLIHYAMLFVNLLSIFMAMYFLIKLLKIYNIKPYFGAIFAINIGYMMTIHYLLAEALPIAFLIAGIYFHQRRNFILMAFLFSLAWLSRSVSCFVTLLPFAFYLLLKKKYKECLLTTISCLPYVFYQIFLILKFGYCSFINQFKVYGTLYSAYSLPFAGLIEWIKRIELERKGISLLWELGVLPFIIFILLCLIFAIKELFKIKTFNIYKFVFLMVGLYTLTRSYEQWSSIAGCTRQSLEIFPFLFLTYATSPNKSFKLLIYLSLIISLLGFVRAINYPTFSYILFAHL